MLETHILALLVGCQAGRSGDAGQKLPDEVFERLGSLDQMIGRPEDVASAVIYAVSQPPNVDIADIVVRPAKPMPLPLNHPGFSGDSFS